MGRMTPHPPLTRAPFLIWGRLLEVDMLIITIEVNAPSGQAIGIKEAIAQDLEKYGDVRVTDIKEISPKQEQLF